MKSGKSSNREQNDPFLQIGVQLKEDFNMEEKEVKHQDRKKGFWEYFDWMVDQMAYLSGAILFFITAAVCYSIGMRFLFTRTTLWIIPITEYALLWIVFLATTWLLREGGHVITEILIAHLDQESQRKLNGIMFTIGGIVCALMCLLGAQHFYECVANRVTDVRAITIPKAAIFMIIPIGSFFLTLQFFRMAWEKISKKGVSH